MIKLVICLLAVCCAAIWRKNKLLFYFLFLMMLLLAAGDLTSPDKDAYVTYYSSVQSLDIHADLEIGFQFAIILAKTIGLSFQLFLFLYVGVCFCLLYRLFTKLSDNKAFALSLYMLFPFILDADQLRSYMGQLIVLMGIVELVQSRRPSAIRYLLHVAVAMLFQESCAIFVIYLLVLLERKKVRKYILILSIAMLSGRYLLPVIASRFFAFNLRKIADYFMGNAGKSNWYIYALFYVIVIAITLFYTTRGRITSRKRFDDLIIRGDFSLFDGTGNEMLIKVNLISIALITLIPMNPHFERLLRPVLMLDYITLTNMVGSRLRYQYEYVIVGSLLFLCIGRFVTYLLGGGWDNYIVPMFFNGSLL